MILRIFSIYNFYNGYLPIKEKFVRRKDIQFLSKLTRVGLRNPGDITLNKRKCSSDTYANTTFHYSGMTNVQKNVENCLLWIQKFDKTIQTISQIYMEKEITYWAIHVSAANAYYSKIIK